MFRESRLHAQGPRISIIVAVKNGAGTLERCIRSVLGQHYPFRELIIIDGLSTDGTCDVIRSYENRIAYWESSRDNGIADAWNKGVEHARGQWLMFLGSDDRLWRADGLSRIAPILKRVYLSCRIVYADVVHVKGGRVVERRGGYWNKQFFSQYMYISHQGILHHRDLFKRYGYFDTTFAIAADYDFLLRALKSENAFYVPKLILSAIEVGGVSNRLENAVQTPVEAQRARKKNGFKRFGLPICCDAMKCAVWMIAGKMFGKSAAYRLADGYRILMGKTPYFSDDRL